MNPNMTWPFLMSLVQDVKRVFPGASVVCAGGAPRDLYHGKEVKDIDIFIQMESVAGWRQASIDEVENQRAAWEKLRSEGHPPDITCFEPRLLREIWKDDETIYQEYYNGCEELSSLWHSPWSGTGDSMDITNSKGYSYGAFTLVDYPCGPRGFPIQLVFIDMDPVENIQDHFDFGLSQIWVTENKVRTLPQFWRDHYRQTITYLPSKEPVLQRRWSSLKRVERLRAKYPGWRFHGLGNLTFDEQELEKIKRYYDKPELVMSYTDGKVERRVVTGYGRGKGD